MKDLNTEKFVSLLKLYHQQTVRINQDTEKRRAVVGNDLCDLCDCGCCGDVCIPCCCCEGYATH